MTLRTLVVTTALVLMIAGAARAAELSTAPMFRSGTHLLVCGIVNISSAPQTIRVRIYDTNGDITTDSGDFVIPARATRSFGVVSSGHCRFTTVNAKTLFRASISVWDGANVIASSPAQ